MFSKFTAPHPNTEPKGHIRPTPRPHFDVLTGLPNHRATKEEIADYQAKQVALDAMIIARLDKLGKALDIADNTSYLGMRPETKPYPELSHEANPVQDIGLSLETKVAAVEVIMSGAYLEFLNDLGLDDESLDREFDEPL